MAIELMFRYANSKIDKDDTLALHLAIEMGHLKTSIVLIEHGINVNDEVSTKTPLHAAVQSHFAEIIPTLLDHGAKIDAVCMSNTILQFGRYTPLHMAAKYGYREGMNIMNLEMFL